MAYTRRTYVDNAAPALSAANLNALETAVEDLKRDTNLYLADYTGADLSVRLADAITDAPNGGRIFVGESGNLPSLVSLNKPGLVIEGVHRGITLTKTGSHDGLKVTAAKAGIRNLTLNGNVGTATGGFLWFASGADEGFAELCDIKNSAVYGAAIDTADHVRVENCHVYGNTSTAIRVANGADGARILYNRVDTTGSAATADGINAFTTTAGQNLADVLIEGNHILTGGASAFGIEVGAFGGNTPKNLRLIGNHTRSLVANNGGISISDIATSVVQGNTYDANGTASNYAIEIAMANGCSITGNTANGGTTLVVPIALNRSKNCAISGNAIYGLSPTGDAVRVYSDSLGTCLDNSITGNTIVFPATGVVDGILVQSNHASGEVSRTVIVGNNIRGNGVAGTIGVRILNSAGAVDRTLVGMNLITNVTTPISQSGDTNTLSSGTVWNQT